MAVIFNGTSRLIEVTDPSDVIIDAQLDIYSAWKDWLQEDIANAGYAPALRTFGGDTTVEGQNAPKYYFLQNYWRVLINNGEIVSVALNLYSDDFSSPYIVQSGSGVSDRNSDAVSVNSEAIEFASFNGGVTIDAINGSPGTSFPIGTPQQPSNNEADTYTIATNRGLTKVYVKGNLNLITNVVSWLGFEFIGESQIKTLITVDTIADVFNCEFYDCTVTGVLDGNSQIRDAIITNLDFVDGFISDCSLGPDIIKLGSSTTANLFNCFSTVPGTSTPTIDINGGSLALRNYNGGIKLINTTSNTAHSIDLAAGKIILDSATITQGTFVVRGVGELIDENDTPILTGTWNGGVIISNGLLNSDSISGGSSVWTRPEVDSLIADTAIIKDQSEISAIHAVEELN